MSVSTTIDRYATGVPIPAARGRMESAREAFFHLLAFATLAAWIFATGSIWFELIDTWFPDATRNFYRQWGWNRVSWQMASIIVAFPCFVYATRSVISDTEANPDKAASAVRRWLATRRRTGPHSATRGSGPSVRRSGSMVTGPGKRAMIAGIA